LSASDDVGSWSGTITPGKENIIIRTTEAP